MSSCRLLIAAGLALLLAACTPTPGPNVPTLAAFPPITPSPDASAATPATAQPATAAAVLPTLTDTPTTIPTNAPRATASPTITPSLTETSPPTAAPSATGTATATATSAPPTLTPSLTITPTLTLTPSATLTPTLDVGGFSALIDLAARVTVQPPEVRYGPATATALWALGDQLAGTALASQPTATRAVPSGPIAIVPGATVAQPGLGTLPPPLTGGGATCTGTPGGAVAALLAADPALSAQLGCATGLPSAVAGAVQPFERGLMIYRPPQLPGAPGVIEALGNDGRFTRYADTWVSGVDPDSAGLTPPPGLVEPIRGFGKVWRGDGALAAQLGWALAGEQGVTLTVQTFERGVAVFVPTLNATYVLADDAPGAATGNWRQAAGGF